MPLSLIVRLQAARPIWYDCSASLLSLICVTLPYWETQLSCEWKWVRGCEWEYVYHFTFRNPGRCSKHINCSLPFSERWINQVGRLRDKKGVLGKIYFPTSVTKIMGTSVVEQEVTLDNSPLFLCRMLIQGEREYFVVYQFPALITKLC